MSRAPNIIFIMTDQQRWDALGCETPGVKTPTLDELARNGIRFRQATCNVPMCVPSRYSLMTGLYPSQLGIRHNTQFAPTDDHLSVPVLPELLGDAGYQTVGVGKTHWYPEIRRDAGVSALPSARGFELRAIVAPSGSSLAEPGARLFGADRPDLWEAMQRETAGFGGGGEGVAGYRGVTSVRPAEDHPEAWLAAQADDFITNNRDRSRPLFLYLSLDAPHPGFAVPREYEELYSIDEVPDSEPPAQIAGSDLPEHAHVRKALVEAWADSTKIERRRTTLRYWAYTTFADAMIGRVLDRLEELGELDDALILFTSDHGDMLGDRGYRFSKYCLYDPSVRVPLIVSGSRIPQARWGAVDERPSELVDVLPTLLTAAGRDPSTYLPGLNLLGPDVRNGAFAEYHGGGYEAERRDLALMWRTATEKLILHLAGPPDRTHLSGSARSGELYDLDHDPGELTNLFDDPACRDRRLALTEDLVLHLASVWGRYPQLPAAREPRGAWSPEYRRKTEKS
jgi:arylsulfatase A-like enzyme